MNVMQWISKMMVNLQVHKISEFGGQGEGTIKCCFWVLESGYLENQEYKTKQEKKKYLEEGLVWLGVGEWFSFGHITDMKF